MVCLKYFKRSDGQALVEAALMVPLIIVFLFTIIWFARIVITWQQIITAARYGTDLILYTPFNIKYIENDIKDYLCNKNTIGRVLDIEKLDIKIEINDYIPFKCDFNMANLSLKNNFLNIFPSLKYLLQGLDKKSFVNIRYSYKVPKILKLMGKENIEIKAHSEVLSGTGSQGSSPRQK
jgi:hypothetical protein